jgi:pyruvate/2-oxoglutarate dehydrogenase complex dihydrolipoamide acyltransferase (E2) component
VHRAAAAASTPGATQSDADDFGPAMAEMTLVRPAAARDSSSAEQPLQRAAAHAAPLEMPLVTPAVARAVDEAGDDRPRGVEAFGRVSREITIDEVQSSVAGQSPDKAAEPNLDVLTERVWERIRRKLRIERERTRGVL